MPAKSYFFQIALIIGIFFPGSTYSQTKEELIGTWKVIKVQLSEDARKEEKAMIGKLAGIFKKTTFNFREDGSFILKSPEKDLNKPGTWVFDENNKHIIVWDKESKGIPGRLMGMFTKKENDNLVFGMEGSAVILTLSKIILTRVK